MKSWWIKLTIASAALLMIAVIGCNKSPVDPLSSYLAPTDNTVSLAPLSSGSVQIKARVELTVQDQLRLMLSGCPDTVIATQNCQITRLKNGGEAPIPFENIQQGDSAEVHAERNQNGTLSAWRIRICSESGQYDLAFRDTIVTIDYALGNFTVAGRSETILVDSNTLVWGVTQQWNGQPEKEQGPAVAAKGTPGGQESVDHHVYFQFSDLAAGDVVEVRAKIVDEFTLLAVSIKIANCEPKSLCQIFESTISSIDYATRVITFTNQDWTGWVCPGAKLTDVAGEPLTLEDFVVGDAVSAKALPTETDTLKVPEMQKL